MTTREEIEGDIRELKGEIRQLNTEIGVLVDHRSTANEELKVSLGAAISDKTALMTAKTGLLAIKEQRLLFLDQQGEIHHIFPFPFPDRLDVILCPFSFDISSSPIQVR